MITVLKKEISVFFSTLIGYLIIGGFLLINGVLLWSDFSKINILDSGYADMDIFFGISPLLFLFFTEKLMYSEIIFCILKLFYLIPFALL